MVNYIKQAKKINKKYIFYKIKKEYKISDEVNTKKKLDNLNLDVKMLNVLSEDNIHILKIQDNIQKVNYNNQLYIQYKNEYNINYNMLLEETKNLRFSFKKIKFKIFTIPLCNKYYRQKPSLVFNIKMFVSYTSPKKKVYRIREKVYNHIDFINLYNEYQQKSTKIKRYNKKHQKSNNKHYQNNKKYQKINNKHYQKNNIQKKLSGADKQRFLILQRDKFRCVCCKKKGGEDGVRLYIQYSHGIVDNKKDMKNFQTVCTSCIEKKVKYIHPLHKLEKRVIENIDISYTEYKENFLPNISDTIKWDEDKQKKLKEKELKRQREIIDKIRKDGIKDESIIVKMAKDEWTSGQRDSLTEKDKEKIKQHDNYTCQLCGKTELDGTTLAVDHIYPVARGGKSEFVNLQTLCRECNSGKRDRVVVFNKYTINNMKFENVA